MKQEVYICPVRTQFKKVASEINHKYKLYIYSCGFLSIVFENTYSFYETMN